MSKISPSGQSMAALFSPEGEKARVAQKDQAQAGSATGIVRIPGAQKLSEGGKTQDSLGNPNSPGYEFFGRKKGSAEGEAGSSASGSGSAPGAEKIGAQAGFTAPQMSSQFIRLANGWEKVLLAQKKLCDKAKALFTKLEGPQKYSGQRKSKQIELKSRGAILDIDLQEAAPDAKEEKKGIEAA